MAFETSNILPEIQSRLHKTINARTHGVIDYIFAGMFLTLGFVFIKSNKRASAASFALTDFSSEHARALKAMDKILN